MTTLSSPTASLVLAGLLATLILLVAASLAATLWGQARQRREFQRLREQLWRGLENMEDDLLEQNAVQRRELSENAQRASEGQISLLSSVMKMQSDQTNSLLERNDARMETLRRGMEEGMRRIAEENGKRLEEMRLTVDEKLHSTLEKRLNDSFAQVSERLEQVYRSLGEMHTLASGVGDLKRMLGNVKTRGVWGEMQLGALLEQALTSSQFARNVATVPGSQERVEFAVVLPGKQDRPVYLPLDSKFPQEDYARLTEAAESGDAAAAEAARRGLAAAVRTEGKRIGKYIAPPHTTDFAVMFLPLEGLYAEVTRNAELVESLQREQRVLVAGPSTLLALLNSLQMGFRTLAIEQRSAEVWKLLGAVKTDFGSFARVLEHTQEKLRQASDSIDSAFARTRTIEKRLRHVEALEEEPSQQLLEDS